MFETEDRHYAEPEKRDWSKSLSDTPGAVALARAIRREIEVAGGRVVPVSRLMV